MSKSVEHFIETITDKIDYFRKEYKLTYSELVGALELIKGEIILECIEEGRKEQ